MPNFVFPLFVFYQLSWIYGWTEVGISRIVG